MDPFFRTALLSSVGLESNNRATTSLRAYLGSLIVSGKPGIYDSIENRHDVAGTR